MVKSFEKSKKWSKAGRWYANFFGTVAQLAPWYAYLFSIYDYESKESQLRLSTICLLHSHFAVCKEGLGIFRINWPDSTDSLNSKYLANVLSQHGNMVDLNCY